MNAPFDLAIYKEALLFLVTAGIVAPLFFRIHVSPVLGYLLAGVALGPFGLGRLAERAPWLDALALTNVETIDRIASFGVVFLLFTIGLELSFERLKRMRRLVFEFGLAQVVVSALALGGAAYALGQRPAAALMIGAALSLSSTAIVIPVLAEEKRLGAAVGRFSFAALLFQDLAVAPLLVLAATLAAGRVESLGASLALTLAPAALALAAVIVVGRLVLRPLFHSVATTRSPEFFMAACLLVVLGAALTAAASGLSMALGAFVAGLLLAETEYRREIEVTIEPFKGLLLGLFFVSIGAELDLSVLTAHPGDVLGLTAAFVVVKAILLFVLARLFGAPNGVAAEVALLLGPGGEFAFVMIGAAVAGRVVRRRGRPDPSRRGGAVDAGDSASRQDRRGAGGAAARERDRRGGESRAAARRKPARHHRRLWPRRSADRRNARRCTAFPTSPSTPTRPSSRASGAPANPSSSATPRARTSCAAAASTRRARWSSPWTRRAPTKRSSRPRAA